MARYALTDIHGCLQTLNALLKRIDLQAEDELYFLGDYISRGPDSRGVVHRIRELEKTQRKVVSLRGNHEQMLIDGDEYDPVRGSWSAEEMKWFKALPYFYLTEYYVMVHAGLNFKTVTDPILDKDAMLWSRNWQADVDLNWLGKRTILHGHTPQRSERTKLQILHQLPTVCLDTGCVHRKPGFGYLTAFDLDARQAVFMRRMEDRRG